MINYIQLTSAPSAVADKLFLEQCWLTGINQKVVASDQHSSRSIHKVIIDKVKEKSISGNGFGQLIGQFMFQLL